MITALKRFFFVSETSPFLHTHHSPSQGGALGSIVGGGTAGAFYVYHRARGIDAMEAYIGDTVENDAERNRIAAEAWDDLQNGANTPIAKE